MEDDVWWVSSDHSDADKKKRRQFDCWCAACGSQCNWRNPNRLLVILDSEDPQRSKNVQGTCAAAGDLCQYCFFLMLLANLQSGSHQRMVQTVCEELQEASRKHLSDELRKFIEGSHQGGGQGRRVDVLSGGGEGDEAGLLGKETLLAHVRESAEELTLRMEEARSRPSWMPPWRCLLLDEDWHLLCQAVHAEAQQQDWQGMCEKCWELRKDLQVTMSGRGERVRVLWSRFHCRASSILKLVRRRRWRPGRCGRSS